LHDTQTLQHDGVNSDGGAFSFTTTGIVTFNQIVAGQTPTAGAHFATKEYVDLALGTFKTFFLSDTGSGVGALNYAYPHETGEAQSEIVNDGGGEAYGVGTHLHQGFISEAGEPATTTIHSGIIAIHLHAKKGNSNQRITTLHAVISSVDADGTTGKTTLITSEVTAELTDTETDYRIHAVIGSDVEVASTSRLICDVYANVTTGAQDSVVTLYMEGTEDSYFTTKVDSGIWQNHGDVLDDLNTVGVVGADSEFLVGTAAGAFAWESGATARTSIGLGTGDSPTLTGLTLSGITQGSLLFTGASGVISQDNSNLFWDDANKRLKIGTAAYMLAPLGITGDAATIEDRHEGIWIRGKTAGYIVQINVRGSRLEIGGGASLDTTPAMSVNYLTGEVGIGMEPSYILDINAGEIGDDNYDGLRIVDTGWKATSHPMLEFYNSNVDFNGSLARIYGEIGNLGINSKLYFAVADSSKNLQDRMVIDKDGNVGIGETNPETLIEWTSTVPYLTLHNSTEEDTDGGGESRIIFKREDGAGAETTAGQIEISHDGSGANDQLGKIALSVNTGAGLVQALEIGSDLLATFGGAINITTIAAEGSDVDKFLVDSSGVVKFRTGTQVLSDIGGQAQSAALTDLTDVGVVTGDNYFLVGTGVGTLAWETTTTVRTSIGLGAGDSPTFAACNLGTGELTTGSINRASGLLTFEIGGTSQVELLDGNLRPTTDNDVSLGNHVYRYNQLYVSTTMGLGINYIANGIMEIGGGRLVFSDGGGATRFAMNFEANTAAIGYAAINVYDYNVGGGSDLSINESGGKVVIGASGRAGQLRVYQGGAGDAEPVLQLDQLDIDDVFINFVGTSAADGTRSISSDTTENSTKFGAVRIEINGVMKWIRIYDNES